MGQAELNKKPKIQKKRLKIFALCNTVRERKKSYRLGEEICNRSDKGF